MANVHDYPVDPRERPFVPNLPKVEDPFNNGKDFEIKRIIEPSKQHWRHTTYSPRHPATPISIPPGVR